MKEIEVLYVYIEANNGYGLSAGTLIDMLNKIEGVNVDLLPINQPNIAKEKKLKEQYDLMINHIAVNAFINDIRSNGYLKMVAGRCKKVFQYLLWEADRLPIEHDRFYQKEWIHGFICPSHFIEGMVNKYKGQRKEVHYIPITTDDVNYNPGMRTADNVFTVLTVAQLSVRKALDVSVCCFATAFYKNPHNVRYYIKVGEKLDNTDVTNLIKANINRCMLPNPNNIYIIEDNLPDHEMEKLYLSSDCYLHLSRGEGFGMTPLTALNYGLPVVYSDWSAHTEFLKEDKRSIPVQGHLDLVHSMDRKFGFEPEMQWFETNQISAVKALRDTYKRWEEKKEKYKTPSVVNKYRENEVIHLAGKMLGIKEIKLKNVNKVGGMNVVEF